MLKGKLASLSIQMLKLRSGRHSLPCSSVSLPDSFVESALMYCLG